MRTIAADNIKRFGYVPLSVYIVALQKGIKVKRQHVLSSRRKGFAAIMPLQTDWKPVMDEYFFLRPVPDKGRRHCRQIPGSEIKDLVFENVR